MPCVFGWLCALHRWTILLTLVIKYENLTKSFLTPSLMLENIFSLLKRLFFLVTIYALLLLLPCPLPWLLREGAILAASLSVSWSDQTLHWTWGLGEGPGSNKGENYTQELQKRVFTFCEDSLGSKTKEESPRKGISDAGFIGSWGNW